MKIVLISVLLAIIAGFGGGWTYQATIGGKSAKSTKTTGASVTTSATSKQTLAECLMEVWGTDKYAAISVNPSLATTDDNLASLKCYE